MKNQIKDKRAISLLISNTLLNSARIVFYVFLNIFIWKNTSDIQIIALFNIVYLTIHFLSYPIFAPIVKLGFKRLLNFISLFGLALVYGMVVYLGNSSIDYIYYIAGFFGFFNGMYWINYHTLQFEVTNFHNRGNYNGIKKSLNMLSQVITPTLIGFIIGLNYLGYGFEIAFSISILFLLVAIYFGNIKTNKVTDTKMKYKHLFKEAHKDKDIFRSLYTHSLTGISFGNTLLEVLIGIIIFNYVKNEADLGMVISLLSIISIIGLYLFGKFISYSKYKLSILITGGLYSVVLIGFVSFDSIIIIILFSALIKVFGIFFSIPQKVISDNVLHKIENFQNYRVEYMVLRELYLYIGWISSFGLLYYINSIEPNKLVYIIIIFIIFTLLATISLSKIDLDKIENK